MFAQFLGLHGPQTIDYVSHLFIFPVHIFSCKMLHVTKFSRCHMTYSRAKILFEISCKFSDSNVVFLF